MDLQSLSNDDLLRLRDTLPDDARPPDSAQPLRITVRPGAGKPLAEWSDAELLAARDNEPGMLTDIAKSAGSGIAKGAANLVGLPRMASDAVGWVMDKTEQRIHGDTDEQFAARSAARPQPPTLLPSADTAASAIDETLGIPATSYKPQTQPGRFAKTVGEFVPGAMLGPGGVARNAVNFAAIPGVASEVAGQLTEGTAAEPWARGGAALVAGGGAAVLNQPRTIDRAVRGAMSANVDDAAIMRAQSLMDDAAARGVRLTIAEALEQVSPGAGLTNLQRIAESAPGPSRDRMSAFMAQRPAQVEGAARSEFGAMAPPPAAPSSIGPAVGKAAEGTVNDVRGAINTAARPFYQAAENVRLTPQEFQAARQLPGWDEASSAIRNDPQLNRYVANLPDDSVGFLNEVKKYMAAASENASAPVNAQRNMQRSAGYGRDAGDVRDIASNARAGQPRYDYAVALGIESVARERYLQPLLDGPLGKLAARDTTTQKAISALFPANPLPNSADEISTAISALAMRNRTATRQLVRAHVESTFNEAAQNLQSGANQFGGAKFAAVLTGNPQQRANLEAAVRAMSPDGDQIWRGFNRFLEIVEATGTRQPKGSLTAFNAQELRDMSTGGAVANVAKTGASPGKWISVVSDAWSRWQLGRNLDGLAVMLTDPGAWGRLRAIAARPRGNAAPALAASLVDAYSGAKGGDRSPKQ